MNLVGAHPSITEDHITFTFTAENRIDFRALVRELASTFGTTIRLQQIGSRDEARLLGGLGPCGRNLCCSQFLDRIESITTEMARLQQMSHRGSDRISGPCGRLICCLDFEHDCYIELAKNLPIKNQKVKTKSGPGTVIDTSIIKQTVLVRLEKEQKEIEVPAKEIK
jgi:cell fate regulator YaaT (PSP1 superfamily)